MFWLSCAPEPPSTTLSFAPDLEVYVPDIPELARAIARQVDWARQRAGSVPIRIAEPEACVVREGAPEFLAACQNILSVQR